MITLSVIIPVYNDPDRLRACLDLLTAQTYPRKEFEVIVVDNGSVDPPREIVEAYPFCRYAEETKPGSYAARNRGLSLAQGSLIAFTDSDCLPDAGWLSESVRVLGSSPEIGLVGGRIEVVPETPESPSAVELYDCLFGLDQERYVSQYRFAATANAVTRRDVLSTVGAFNSDLKSGGDLEFGQRVAASGLKIVYAADAVVRHPARRSMDGLLTQARRHAGGNFDRRRRTRVRALSPKFWKNALRAVLPNFGKLYRAWVGLRRRGYGVREWRSVAAIALKVHYSTLSEYFRKALGAKSERT